MLFFLICLTLIALPLFGKETFVLGNEVGDGLLVSPRHVKEGPDKNIYVYDLKEGCIKVYSPSGTFLRKIGSKGEGPGNIKRIDGLNFGFTADNRLYFTQYFGGHRWITFLNLNGKFQHLLTPKIKEKMFGVENSVSLTDGGFLIEFSFWGKAEKKSQYYLHSDPRCIFHISSKGDIISKIKEANYFSRISYYATGGDLEIPFTPIFKWCQYKDDTIIFTDGSERNLKILNYKGELVNEIKTSLPDPVVVRKKDLDEWRERVKNLYNENSRDIAWYKKYGKVIENYKKSIYSKKPYIEDLFVTPEGNILITGSLDSKKEKDFWLLDEKGKTQLKIILNVYKLKIFKSFVFLNKIEDDGNNLLYCVKRDGSEKQDLIRVEKEFK